ncbi:AraC family transcriptional regulator [Saccharibacillus qingshengii]|uniref:AraC family transcriptional regulator n=1 Tax=Saccharibacillus qingshengii TaxID=1763540 RepID=UPI001553D2E2|nr:GyrI-like domain-containing protein [Saccharibacillus qingshengii]
MVFTIEHMPKARVIFARKTGPYGPQNQETMEHLKAWARRRNLLRESTILLGIAQDNPQLTPPEQCRYDACLIIREASASEIGDLQDTSLRLGKFPGGIYAVFKTAHTPQGVNEVWASAFPALIEAGILLDERPAVERYTGSLLSEGVCELCVPIRQS